MTEVIEKKKAASASDYFVMVLLLLQPLLDVLSYFMQEWGDTAVTTGLRMAVLVTVSLYGFWVSEKKRTYILLWSGVIGFWLLHAINGFRVGYQDPMGDLAEYLKLVQLPLWSLAFYTFFKKSPALSKKVITVLAVNVGVIILIILISFGTGNPVYTYDYPERDMQIGLLGWFGVPNSQSAIVGMLGSFAVLWGFQTGKVWVMSLTSLFGMGLLYVTGTRFAYISAICTALGFLILFLWNRRPIKWLVPMAVFLILLVALVGYSPMQARQEKSQDSQSLYQEKTDAVMGEYSGFVAAEGEEIPSAVLERIETVYKNIYGIPGPYNIPLLGDHIEKYGLENVMKAYHYTTASTTLYNSRIYKIKFLQLNWEEKDLFTKLVGFEYAEAKWKDNIYDPENDFQPLKYYYGYLGAGLYGLFLIVVILYTAFSFFRNWRTYLTEETGAYLMMLVFGLAAAQFSGQVLRRPNVVVYLALAIGYLLMYNRKINSSGRIPVSKKVSGNKHFR